MERPPLVKVDAIIYDQAAQAKLIAKLKKDANEKGCWEWQGSLGQEGYGNFPIRGSTEKAHRIAYRFFKGPIPPGMCVCHTCDNPPCCNPDHLWLGTWMDNVRDKYAKGRGNHARGERNGAVMHPERLHRGPHKTPRKLIRGLDHWAVKNPERLARGEKHKKSKLTKEKVIDIRRRCANRENCYALAEEFGVSSGTVHAAAIGETWKHIPGALERCENWPEHHARGESVNTAVLNNEKVIEIRRIYESKEMGPAAIGRKYGISRGNVFNIVKRYTRKHI